MISRRPQPLTPGNPYLLALRTSYENARFTQRFGRTGFYLEPGGFHSGVDLVLPSNKPLTPADVRTPVSGEVIEATPANRDNTGFGEHIRVSTGAGYKVTLGHFGAGTLNVRRGDLIRAGDIVGKQGSTGASSGTHLHLQIQDTDTGQAVNPMPSTRDIFKPGAWKDLYYTAAHRLGFGAGFTPSQVLEPPTPGERLYSRVEPNNTYIWGDRYGETVVPFPSSDPNIEPNPEPVPPGNNDPNGQNISFNPLNDWVAGYVTEQVGRWGVNIGLFLLAAITFVVGLNYALKERPVQQAIEPVKDAQRISKKTGKGIARIAAAVATKGKSEAVGVGSAIQKSE